MIINQIAAVIILCLGLLSISFPQLVASQLGFTGLSDLADIELRATYGAFFIALAVGLIYFNQQDMYVLVGYAWFAAGFLRLVALILKPISLKKNLGGVLVELGTGLLLIV